jgi:hypothetical protein
MRDRVRALLLVTCTACWASQHQPPPRAVHEDLQPTPVVVQPTPERRATLRVDDHTKAARFQGVWLEQSDGSRWVVDYRARSLWTWFADREVIVTGECYQPIGSAITAPHFRVDTLRPATAERGRGPYLAMGPEQLLRGELVTVAAPAGGKAAGTSRVVFRAADGEYTVVGETGPDQRGAFAIRGRVLEPDMSYVARTSGPDLWITEIYDIGHDERGASQPKATPCP